MFDRLGTAVLEFYYAPGEKTEFDEDVIAIHHINTDPLQNQEKVNSHIRAMELINNNYILAGLEDYKKDQPYAKLFHSELPVLIIANNEDGTKLVYQQVFSLEELVALVMPFTI